MPTAATPLAALAERERASDERSRGDVGVTDPTGGAARTVDGQVRGVSALSGVPPRRDTALSERHHPRAASGVHDL
jgi:hypothetical protein